MLEQKKAKLLDEIYRQVNLHKGVGVAESFLQHLLANDITTRPMLNSYLDCYVDGHGDVLKRLQNIPFDKWILVLDEFVMKLVIKKYDEAKTWQVTEKQPTPLH